MALFSDILPYLLAQPQLPGGPVVAPLAKSPNNVTAMNIPSAKLPGAYDFMNAMTNLTNVSGENQLREAQRQHVLMQLKFGEGLGDTLSKAFNALGQPASSSGDVSPSAMPSGGGGSGVGSGGSASVTDLGPNQVKIAERLAELGHNPVQIASALGWGTQESGTKDTNTTALNMTGKDGRLGGSEGWQQWLADRRVALNDFARAQGKAVSDPTLQADFFDREMRTPGSGAGQAAQQTYWNAVSPEQGVMAMAHFGRGAGYTPDNPQGTVGYGNRLSAANQFYDLLTGKKKQVAESSPSPSSDQQTTPTADTTANPSGPMGPTGPSGPEGESDTRTPVERFNDAARQQLAGMQAGDQSQLGMGGILPAITALQAQATPTGLPTSGIAPLPSAVPPSPAPTPTAPLPGVGAPSGTPQIPVLPQPPANVGGAPSSFSMTPQQRAILQAGIQAQLAGMGNITAPLDKAFYESPWFQAQRAAAVTEAQKRTALPFALPEAAAQAAGGYYGPGANPALQGEIERQKQIAGFYGPGANPALQGAIEAAKEQAGVAPKIAVEQAKPHYVPGVGLVFPNQTQQGAVAQAGAPQTGAQPSSAEGQPGVAVPTMGTPQEIAFRKEVDRTDKLLENYDSEGKTAIGQVGMAQQISDLLPRVQMGWRADTVQAAGRILETLGVSKDNLQTFLHTDPSAADALNKMFLGFSTGAVREMGAREPGSVISLFMRNFPNLETLPDAAKLMTNALQMQAQWKTDRANAAQQWAADQRQNMGRFGENYKGMTGFEKQFAETNNPRDYWRAAVAMSGQAGSPEQGIAWKGLDNAEATRIYNLIPRGTEYIGPDNLKHIKR